MSELLSSGYVNWVDGMKMSKAHLLQLQQAVEDRLKDARMMADALLDHGLLGPGPNGESALDLSMTFEGRSRYQVELRQCRAVTSAGSRIEVLAHEEPIRLEGEVQPQLIAEGNAFDVVLRISPEVAEPYGVPNPAESPIRHPSLRPACVLEVAPVKELRQGAYARHHLAIARFRVVKDELERDADFIPPSLFMCSLPRLQDFMREYLKFLKEIERNLMRIVIKQNALKDRTELQDSVDAHCRTGLRFLEQGLATVQFYGDGMRPREVVQHAAQFARALHHAIELLTGRGKEGFLDYVREHTLLKPAEHQATLTGLMDLSFDTTDLRTALSAVTLFCRTHKKLIDKWVGLDYIGQKQDKDIFIAQDGPAKGVVPRPAQPEARPPKQSDGWDF